MRWVRKSERQYDKTPQARLSQWGTCSILHLLRLNYPPFSWFNTSQQTYSCCRYICSAAHLSTFCQASDNRQRLFEAYICSFGSYLVEKQTHITVTNVRWVYCENYNSSLNRLRQIRRMTDLMYVSTMRKWQAACLSVFSFTVYGRICVQHFRTWDGLHPSHFIAL